MSNLKQFVCLVLALVLNTAAYARASISVDEQRILQGIVNELRAADELIQEAQRNADRQDRYRFGYRCLITDINLVQRGLLTAIHGTANRAFQNQELCADYGYSGQYGNESAFLQQYIHELQALIAFSKYAASKAKQHGPARFNYEILQSDIETIIAGIERALVGSGEQPRTFPVLRGKFAQ